MITPIDIVIAYVTGVVMGGVALWLYIRTRPTHCKRCYAKVNDCFCEPEPNPVLNSAKCLMEYHDWQPDDYKVTETCSNCHEIRARVIH